MFDIIGIDSSCVDHIVSIDRMPYKDEEISICRQSWQGGGKVATALAAASRLGAKTALLGVLGDDVMGRFLIRDLCRDGVDVSRFLTDAGTKSDYCISLAEKQTGGRSFLVEWGNHRSYSPGDFDPDFFAQARCLHLHLMDETDVAAAKLAKRLGVKVGFDADAYDERVMENIGLIDYFIGSEFFYKSLYPGLAPEEGCQKLLAQGPELAIFTFGSEGCAGAWKQGAFRCPAWKVEAIDTTGAGDTFHGAFLYALLCQSLPVPEAAGFASAVSAIKCLFLGGRAGLPTLDMTRAFMANGTFDRGLLEKREAEYAAFLSEK